MEPRYLKLKEKIDAIEALRVYSAWGPEYYVWENLTAKVLEREFGPDALKLFKRQQSVVLDDDAYQEDLGKRKRLLETILANRDEYMPARSGGHKDLDRGENNSSMVGAIFNHSNIHFGTGANFLEKPRMFSSSLAEKGIPVWLQYVGVAATVAATFWGVFVYFYPDGVWANPSLATPNEGEFATSTLNIGDLLAKALTYETVVERQDFLSKYIGHPIYAVGTVREISRSGSGFLIDMTVKGKTITCFQEQTQENEKIIPLLQGKSVQFVGTFPFTEVYGHGLEVGGCVFSRL